jgi:hypothetical protein
VTQKQSPHFAQKLDVIEDKLAEYRRSINDILSRKLARPRERALVFFKVLLCTSDLYAENLRLREIAPKVFHEAEDWPKSPVRPLSVRSARVQEVSLRGRLERRLELLDDWGAVEKHNAFAEENRLFRAADYIGNLALHLPEMYVESFHLRSCFKSFRRGANLGDATEIFVGMQHLAHHATYCRFALEIVSDELHWTP